MKFNFKKIASVLTSTVMLSSTVAFAAAANFPAPFVEDDKGAYAIVTGTNGLDTDAALDINKYLSDMVTDLDEDTEAITVEGDSFMLEDKNDKFNLGDALNSTESTLDDDQLSTILAEGIYEDEAGNEYDYKQSIELAKAGGITLTHFADGDVDPDEKPVIGFDIAKNVEVLEYTLDFTDKPDVYGTTGTDSNMETTDLTFLGKTYYVSAVDNSSALEITLLDSANSATVFSDSPVTVEVAGESYEVEIVAVTESDTASNSKATLKINGEQISSTNQGSSRKIGDDLYLSILEVNEASRESDSHYVEFSIGNGEIVLVDGAEVEINDEAVDGLTVDFTVVADELDDMTLTWTTDEQVFLYPGEELVLPGFESIKLIMGDFVGAYDETIELKYSSDNYIYVDVPVKDGDVSIPLLFFDGNDVIDNLGSDSDEVLVTATGTSPSLSVSEDDNSMFVATSINGDEAESYLFQITDISEEETDGTENKTTIKNLGSGDSETVYVSDASEDVDFGEVTLTVSNINGDEGTATIALSGTGDVYADRVVTEEGLMFTLPVASTNSSVYSPYTVVVPGVSLNTTGGTELTASSTSWMMNVTEEDYDTEEIGEGDSFYLNLSYAAGDGPEVSRISGITTIPVDDDSDDEEGYMVSEMATKVLYKAGDDQRTLTIMYNGEEAYAQVYVAEGDASTMGGGSTSGSMVFNHDEEDKFKSKNLIVVGGSCVNKVAARLLGKQADFPVCGDAWEEATGAGPGEFLIKTFNNPWTTGKVATLVAGYNQPDTASAAIALITDEDIDITVGVTHNPGLTAGL